MLLPDRMGSGACPGKESKQASSQAAPSSGMKSLSLAMYSSSGYQTALGGTRCGSQYGFGKKGSKRRNCKYNQVNADFYFQT